VGIDVIEEEEEAWGLQAAVAMGGMGSTSFNMFKNPLVLVLLPRAKGGPFVSPGYYRFVYIGSYRSFQQVPKVSSIPVLEKMA
jgi:hypothetical protein